MTVKRLDHIQICMPPGAEEQTRQFYAQMLGLREIEKPSTLGAEGGVWFQVGDIELHVSIEVPHSLSRRHPAFEVEGLEEFRRLLVEQGVTIQEQTPILGRSRFAFRDPFGNRIEFLEWER